MEKAACRGLLLATRRRLVCSSRNTRRGCWCDSPAGWVRKRRQRDVLQEAFIAAYQQLAELRAPERFGAWLCSIADNKARMWQRRRITQLNLLDQLDLAATARAGRSRRLGALVRKGNRAIERSPTET